jgi:hypothetical protein
VNEQEWLACTDPASRLSEVCAKVSHRKQRLFAVGCCYQI